VDDLWRRLDGMDYETTRAVTARVHQLRVELVDRLLAVPSAPQVPGGEPVPYATALEAYVREVDELLLRWAAAADGAGAATLNQAAGLGAEGFNSLLLRAATGPLPVLGLTEDLARAAALYRAQFMRSWGQSVATRVAEEVQRVVFGAQSRWDAVRNIRSALATASGQKPGTLTSAAIRAERTALISVFNAAAGRSLSAAVPRVPGLMAEWSAAHQAVTCSRCRSLDGVRVKPGRRFPGGPVAPPLHHNCRCRVVPWVPGWES
jgi:hypothetical protein